MILQNDRPKETTIFVLTNCVKMMNIFHFYVMPVLISSRKCVFHRTRKGFAAHFFCNILNL